MTIDETIKRCEELAEKNEKQAKEHHDNQVRKCEVISFAEMDYTRENECLECAKEHRQIAEWLKCLKAIWDSGDCNDCRNGQCEWKPKLGELVRFNCPHYVGVATGEVNADEDNSGT